MFSHEHKTTSWLPPPETWSTFQEIKFLVNFNNTQLVNSSISTSAELLPVFNHNNTDKIGKCLQTNNLSNFSVYSDLETNSNCSAVTNTEQFCDSFFQVKLPFGWEEAESKEFVKYYIK